MIVPTIDFEIGEVVWVRLKRGKKEPWEAIEGKVSGGLIKFDGTDVIVEVSPDEGLLVYVGVPVKHIWKRREDVPLMEGYE